MDEGRPSLKPQAAVGHGRGGVTYTRPVSPWLRLLLGFAGVAGAALILKAFPPLLVLALLVGGVTYANYHFKVKRRREASMSGAQLLGLQHAADDPFGLLGYPLALF